MSTPATAPKTVGTTPKVRASSVSWWLEEALKHEGNPAPLPVLQGTDRADVAIVGGGYTGLWAAIHLKTMRPSLEVVAIEASICGSGASSRNAGKVHGYWMSLPTLASMLGHERALETARLGSTAQDGVRAFVQECGDDLWWIEGGGLKVATTATHERKLTDFTNAMAKLGVSRMARAVKGDELRNLIDSPVFRTGVFFPEEATVHPGRLVRALRRKALQLGVRIYEQTSMTGVTAGTPNRIRTAQGEILASEVVLATNAALADERDVRTNMVAFSSFAMVTAKVDNIAECSGWHADCSLSDARMFLNYARKTADGRILFGAGSGPIAYGGRTQAHSLSHDQQTVDRVEAAMRRLLPKIGDLPVERAWGGPIDVSSDRMPYAGTRNGTRIHYGFGYSGHGVNPSYIVGKCLASLALREENEWTRSAFCRRKLPTLPPEPFRYIGGSMIRSAILSCEDAEEQGRKAALYARTVARLPALLNLRIGVR
jgi:glycine/D-amino acid oxidase-like deaminating enzyme